MKRQRGVVLLLALVISLLLGVLAASALRAAVVETQMAGVLRDGLLAFEQAEATLLAGQGALHHQAPAPCQPCAPPERPHALEGHWHKAPEGFYQIQQLGISTRAAHVPQGLPVTLFRVTAVSLRAQPRQVLEAVYAINGDQTRRIAWRQRVQGD